MKTKGLLTAVAIGALVSSGIISLTVTVQAQAPKLSEAEAKTEAEMRDLLKERGGALDRALENSKVERARIEAERATADPELRRKLEEAVARGGRPAPSAEEVEENRIAEEQLERARAKLSDAAKTRMAQAIADDPPARALPVTPPTDPVKPADFGSAQPTQPEKADIEPKKVSNRVKVTASGAAEFDSNTGIAIFTKDVVVEHPSFHLECDELEVHMAREAALKAKDDAKEGETPAPAPVPAAPLAEEGAAVEEEGGSGIDLAIARGRMVVLRKKSEDGKLQVGHCRYAIFDGKTGDIEMRVWPQIQKGNEILQAAAEHTRIIIKQDGQMKAIGPVKLVADSKEKKN